MKWLKQKWAITKYYWRWLWMSRADRARAKAMGKLLFNVLGNAPMDKIMGGESCFWDITPVQAQGSKEGLEEYVKAVKGKDVS